MMNIDDLKDAWNKDEPDGMRLPISTSMLGKTTSAVAKVRKNMKAEFIATLISYLVITLFLFHGQQNAFFFNTTSILLFTLLLLNAYYFTRFYVFYKSISHYDLNMRDSINKVAYELELNTELYKAYNFCATPLAVMVFFSLAGGKQTSDYVQHILTTNSIISAGALGSIFITILIAFLLTYAGITLHVRLQYGKYLAELKRIMTELN